MTNQNVSPASRPLSQEARQFVENELAIAVLFGGSTRENEALKKAWRKSFFAMAHACWAAGEDGFEEAFKAKVDIFVDRFIKNGEDVEYDNLDIALGERAAERAETRKRERAKPGRR